MQEIDISKLGLKSIGSLVGVVIGDVFGLPVECQSPLSIIDKFGYLDSAVSCKHHPFSSVAKRSAGTKSDDTQLTETIMHSLRRSKGYNLNDIRKAHIEASNGLFGTPLGWGKSTRESVEKMKKGFVVTNVPDGAGNGPVIKIAPLAIYSVYKCLNTPHRRFTNSFNHSLLKKCKEITELTHGDPACIVASYCHCRMLIRALQNEIPKNSHEIAKLFIDDSIWAESKIGGTLSSRLREVFEWNVLFDGNKMSSFNIDTKHISVKICSEKSSYIYNSYPLVAYCVAKYLPFNNFRYSILETINAGADADSNGSMVGSIIGAHLGFDSIPEDMIKSIKDWPKILASVRHFVAEM